jgi:hypothetical protein
MADRRRVMFISFIAVGVATVAALAAGLLLRFETVNERHDTHAALWTNHPDLAERLPVNVTEIRLRYYVDAPYRFVAFRVPAMRPTEWGKACRLASAAEVRFASGGPPPSWWPKELTDAALGVREGYQFVRCKLDPPYGAYQDRPTGWIAFRASDGHGYWWDEY